jgi:hypothetical protein
MHHMLCMKILLIGVVAFSIILAACRQPKRENPLEIANHFCDCITTKLQGAKDSSVNIDECNFILFKSRFVQIWFDEDHAKYSQKTLDSAGSFFHEVAYILDTMGYNKIDYRKIKVDAHQF